MYLSQTHQAQSPTANNLEGDVRGLAPLSNVASSCEPDDSMAGNEEGRRERMTPKLRHVSVTQAQSLPLLWDARKAGCAPEGVSGGVSAHSGEFSSDNTVSSRTHPGRFGEIVDGRWNTALRPSRAYGRRGSNLCDICDNVLWLSITFNCRT